MHRSGHIDSVLYFMIFYILLTSSISSPVLLTSLLHLFSSTVCQDQGPKCADLALSRKCTEGDKRLWMLTNCPQSCGLCQGRADAKASFGCHRTKEMYLLYGRASVIQKVGCMQNQHYVDVVAYIVLIIRCLSLGE